MSLSKEVNKLFDEIEYKISKFQKKLVDRKEPRRSTLPGGGGGGYQPHPTDEEASPPPKKQ